MNILYVIIQKQIYDAHWLLYIENIISVVMGGCNTLYACNKRLIISLGPLRKVPSPPPH